MIDVGAIQRSMRVIVYAMANLATELRGARVLTNTGNSTDQSEIEDALKECAARLRKNEKEERRARLEYLGAFKKRTRTRWTKKGGKNPPPPGNRARRSS